MSASADPRPDYYVIAYDAGEALPYGVAWFAEIGRPFSNAFRYFATRAECIEHVGRHVRYTRPVCLSDDSPDV